MPIGTSRSSLVRIAVSAALLLSPATAAADDASDCIGAEPAAGVAACTRLIEAAASADTVVAAYVARAKHRTLLDELDAALADVDEALRRDPRHADALHNRGVVYSFQGRYDEALAALDEAIRLSPATSAESRHTRGRIRLELGDLGAALVEFDSALAVDARHVDALISRGGAYQLAGDAERALADYDAALRIDAANPDALSSRGVLFLATDRFDEAIVDLDRALEADPGYGRAYASRGLARLLQGHSAEALPDFDRAIELEPENLDYYYQRASAHAAQGKLDPAVADLRQVLARDPSNAAATAALRDLGVEP